MSPQDWIKKQQDKLQQIAAGKALEIAAIETHRAMANRIFIEGQASDGPIGAYNATKPLYVNPKNSPKGFNPMGKNGTETIKVQYKTKSGKVRSKKVAIKSDHTERKTKYFDSYKAFRAEIGAITDKVNLTLFGDMRNDFISGLQKVNSSVWISRFKRDINNKKKSGQEEHFKKPIFRLTKAERKLFVDTVNKETQRILHAQ